jgi:hypothetical protein
MVDLIQGLFGKTMRIGRSYPGLSVLIPHHLSSILNRLCDVETLLRCLVRLLVRRCSGGELGCRMNLLNNCRLRFCGSIIGGIQRSTRSSQDICTLAK